MKLTTKSEYAILALIYLARHAREDFVHIEDIARYYELSKKYLEQIFVALKQNRYLKSRTGRVGGYKLAVPAGKIKIADVIRLMDGALAPTVAVSKYFYSETPLEKEKKIIAVLKEIREFVSNRLENLSLSDLV